MAEAVASTPVSDRARETDICSEASGHVTGTRKKKKKNKRKRKNSEGDSNDDSCLLEVIKQQNITIKNLQLEVLNLTKILKKGELEENNQESEDEMLTDSIESVTDNGNVPAQQLIDNADSNVTQDLDRQNNKVKEGSEIDGSDSAQSTNPKYAWITNKSNKNKKSLVNNIKPSAKNAGCAIPSNTTTAKKASTTPIKPKPSPIYLREKCSNELISQITSIIGSGNFHAVSMNRPTPETKVQVKEETHFRIITAELEKLGKQFYTFQLKSEKGLTVVIRGIEPEVPVVEIKEAIEKEGFIVRNVHNIMNRFKVQQPLHLIVLDPEAKKPKKSEVHPIYKIRYLLHRKITVEEPRRRSGPIQCFNCQEYGHTKSYCQLPTVCVIRGDNHSSADCNKDKKDPRAKLCKNCGGNHTANFRGCAVYTHIKKKSVKSDHGIPIRTENIPPSRVQSGTTYAHVATGKTSFPNTKNNASPSNEVLMSMLSTFMSSMQNMMTQITSLLSSK